MSAIELFDKLPAGTTVARETVANTLALVLGGKSRDLTRMAKGMTEAEAEAMIQTGRYLAHVDSTATTGLAVIAYTLLEAKAVENRTKLAEALGVSQSRVTQVVGEGRTIVELGDPTTWGKSAITVTQLRALTQGKGSADLREALDDDKLKVADKRTRIAHLVSQRQAEAAQAKLTAAANREAEAKAKKLAEDAKAAAAKAGQNGAPEVSKGSAAQDVTAEAIGAAVVALAEAVDILAVPATWERLTEAQQQVVAACIASMVRASE